MKLRKKPKERERKPLFEEVAFIGLWLLFFFSKNHSATGNRGNSLADASCSWDSIYLPFYKSKKVSASDTCSIVKNPPLFYIIEVQWVKPKYKKIFKENWGFWLIQLPMNSKETANRNSKPWFIVFFKLCILRPKIHTSRPKSGE